MCRALRRPGLQRIGFAAVSAAPIRFELSDDRGHRRGRRTRPGSGSFHLGRRRSCRIQNMTDLSPSHVTQRWPASYPDRLQLIPRPHALTGVKVSMMLETGLPYEPYFLSTSRNSESKDPAVRAVESQRPHTWRSSIRLAPTASPLAYGKPVRSSSIWPTRRAVHSTTIAQRYETWPGCSFRCRALGPTFDS